MDIKTYSQTRNAAGKSMKRGQMYYVKQGKDFIRNEGTGRPAIIVSDEQNNQENKVMVVYVTSKQTTNPYLVPVETSYTQSYAICNNIGTIYKDRFENYIRDVSEEEMKAIEEMMQKSLGIKQAASLGPICIGCTEKEENKRYKATTDKIATERDFYKKAYDDLLEKMLAR